jgi:hypothetical protein
MTSVVVKANERVAYVGKTGSGKTFLARHVLAPIRRLVVFDPKATLGGPEWNLESGREAERRLLRGGDARIRIRAPLDDDWTPYLRMVWEARNVTLYIDEVYALVPEGKRAPAEFNALYTRGREMGIGVHASTQRPRSIPAVTLTEAEWLFVFRVARPEDRNYVAGFGDEQGLMKGLPRDEHGFWTYKATWRKPIYTPRFQARRAIPTTTGEKVEVGA